MIIANAARRALNLLLPHVCPGCNRCLTDQPALCLDCWSALTILAEPCCQVCGIPFELPQARGALCPDCLDRRPGFDRARAVLRYDDHSRPLVINLKHGDRTDTATLLAGWMQRSGCDLLEEADVIAPVPLHRLRLLRRRYNQSALLAREIGRLSGLPVAYQLLRRIRATPSQGRLGRAVRRRNMARAFAPGADAHGLEGRRILLIDDVLTTGATASACAHVLKAAGARAVDVLTLARVDAPGR